MIFIHHVTSYRILFIHVYGLIINNNDNNKIIITNSR